MEKYSKWRDPGTGIAPFLPIVPPKHDKRGSFTVYLFVKRVLIGPLLVLLRLPVLMVLGLIACFLNELEALLPLSFIRKWGLSGVLRFKLFLMGFYWIPLKPASLKRGAQSLISSLPRDGDVIFCNSSSYLDVLILQIKFNPVFTLICSDTGKVLEVPIGKILRSYATITPPSLESSSLCTLAALSTAVAKRKGGPIVVFFEGTTTNGRGLLSPVANLLNGFSSSFFLVHIRYPAIHYSPTFPVGSLFWHVFGLCSQITNSATLRMASKLEVQRNLKQADLTVDQLVTLFTCTCGLKPMSLSINDKRQFIEYYYLNGSIKKLR